MIDRWIDRYTFPYPDWFVIPNSDLQPLKGVRINLAKNRQMVIHALAPQCDLSVLSYSKYKIAKMFQGFSPGYHWGGLTAPHRPASCTTGFVLAMLVEKRTFPKN